MQNVQRIRQLKRVLLHSTFWCCILLFFSSIFGVGNTIDINVFYFSLCLMPVTIGATYVSIYKLLPDYLMTRRYLLFGLYSVYTLVVLVSAVIFSIFFALAVLTDFKFAKMTTLSKSAVFIITSICLVVIIVSAFKLLKLNLNQSRHNAELEAKILEARLKLKDQELKYLKMQIHPHFLFNTLNTLYGASLKRSDDAPEMILKLSNLLDYLLYQVDKPLVALSEEINHIEDYISLEQMRFADTLDINLSQSRCSEPIAVAPMLFLPFVENSFKHGRMIDGKLKINIDFQCDRNTIQFYITNSHAPSEHTEHGIGLENIKKRLELLYKNRYDLSIAQTASEFKVALKLNTSIK